MLYKLGGSSQMQKRETVQSNSNILVDVLSTLLYKVVLTSEPVGGTVMCDHSNESHWVVLFYDALYFSA